MSGTKYGVLEHRKPGKGVLPLFGGLYIVNKLRKFYFHQLKEDIIVRKSVKEGFYCYQTQIFINVQSEVIKRNNIGYFSRTANEIILCSVALHMQFYIIMYYIESKKHLQEMCLFPPISRHFQDMFFSMNQLLTCNKYHVYEHGLLMLLGKRPGFQRK